MAVVVLAVVVVVAVRDVGGGGAVLHPVLPANTQNTSCQNHPYTSTHEDHNRRHPPRHRHLHRLHRPPLLRQGRGPMGASFSVH